MSTALVNAVSTSAAPTATVAGHVFSRAELRRIGDFADACGFQDELFSTVVAKWTASKAH